MQTRLQSFIESTINVLLGWIVALVLQLFIFPLYGIHVPISTNIQISIIFTIAAILRSYLVRRYFNNKIHNLAIKLAHDK